MIAYQKQRCHLMRLGHYDIHLDVCASKHANHKSKEELVLCLMALVKGGDHEELEYEEEWTRSYS